MSLNSMTGRLRECNGWRNRCTICKTAADDQKELARGETSRCITSMIDGGCLNAFHTLHKLVQFGLRSLVLGKCVLVLLLPLVALLLSALDLTLKVLCLDIDLTQFFRRLLNVLLRRVELLLEE